MALLDKPRSARGTKHKWANIRLIFDRCHEKIAAKKRRKEPAETLSRRKAKGRSSFQVI